MSANLDELVDDDDDDPYGPLRLDPDGSPVFMAMIGLKGSGKSYAEEQYLRSWPYDALIIDPTKDVDPAGEFTVPWPGGDSWPAYDPEHPEACRRFLYRPNRNDPEHREKTDRLVMLAHEHPAPVLVGLDEGRYLFGSSDKMLPGSDVVMNEGRHGPTFLIVACPRTTGIRPLLWHQADLIWIFGFMSINDCRDIAPNYGLTAEELQQLVRTLEHKEVVGGDGMPHTPSGFVLLDKRGPSVYVFPPLP